MKYMEPFVDALITNVGDREVPNKLDVVLEGGAQRCLPSRGTMLLEGTRKSRQDRNKEDFRC